MGFVRGKYNNNRVSLMVSFNENENPDNYFAGDSVEEALAHFGCYVKDGAIYEKTKEAAALEATGVQSVAEATELREKINEIINAYSDEQAVDNIILFPPWLPDRLYIIGKRVRYNDKLYKVLQEHNSQENWKPDVAVSLYAEILTGEGDEPKEWVQPDSTNPYMTGDRVKFEGKIYESLIDNNVWSPAAYPAGWGLIG